MADIFQTNAEVAAVAPFTADKCAIIWGDNVAGAMNVTVSYAQQVNRRRTIGNKQAMLWATLPNGQITVGRLMAENAGAIFSAQGWNACNPGPITLQVAGCKGALNYTALSAIVTQYQVSVEAEGLTVMDNIVIEFLSLVAGGG
jgi:hypothetical protein